MSSAFCGRKPDPPALRSVRSLRRLFPGGLPERALESGASTADSRTVGLGGAFGHPAAMGRNAASSVSY